MFLQVCRRLYISALSFNLKLQEGVFGFKLKTRSCEVQVGEYITLTKYKHLVTI